jgi:hypothetical protein
MLVLIVTAAAACPVAAQTRVFVAGGMFADIKRFSGDASTPTLDGNAVGGGARAGVIVSERWSVSLDVDFGASTTTTAALPIGVLSPLDRAAAPIALFRSRITNRLVATSALLGYHAPSGHRVRPAVFGGLTFMHVIRRFDTTIPPPIAYPASSFSVQPDGIVVTQAAGSPLPSLVVRPHEEVDNVPAATIAAEAAIDLNSHLAAVPEVRAHTFSLSGGPGGFAIRPGIAIRWTF